MGCESTDCSIHDSWHTQQLNQKLSLHASQIEVLVSLDNAQSRGIWDPSYFHNHIGGGVVSALEAAVASSGVRLGESTGK